MIWLTRPWGALCSSAITATARCIVGLSLCLKDLCLAASHPEPRLQPPGSNAFCGLRRRSTCWRGRLDDWCLRRSYAPTASEVPLQQSGLLSRLGCHGYLFLGWPTFALVGLRSPAPSKHEVTLSAVTCRPAFLAEAARFPGFRVRPSFLPKCLYLLLGGTFLLMLIFRTG